VTAGGECEPGECFRKAARRELFEETGIIVDDLGREVARMTPEFTTVEGELVQAYERFFLVRVADAAIDTSRHTESEQALMTQHRWFTLDELESWPEAIFPAQLADLIRSQSAT
jgi:8-oxo-dGTP pyrophosphatase MutT (NUDIX family)